MLFSGGRCGRRRRRTCRRRRIFKSVSESLSESVFESVLAGRIRRLDPKLHIKRPQAADTLLPARSD